MTDLDTETKRHAAELRIRKLRDEIRHRRGAIIDMPQYPAWRRALDDMAKEVGLLEWPYDCFTFGDEFRSQTAAGHLVMAGVDIERIAGTFVLLFG